MLPDFSSTLRKCPQKADRLLCSSEHSSSLVLDPQANSMFSETASHLIGTIDHSRDIPFSVFPKSAKIFGAPTKTAPAVPDITKGLGRSQRDQDIVSLCQFVQESLRLSVFDGNLYQFDGPCWHRLDDAMANAVILELLTKAGLGYCLSGATIGKIKSRLLMTKELHRDSEFSPPELCINFADGTFNVETGVFYPHTEEDDFTSFISLRYSDIDRVQDGSVFEAFATQVSNGDSRIRQQLLELVGIALTNIELKYFFVLIGESHTGKSQFGRFLADLLGHNMVGTVPDIHSFARTFTSSVCEGKRLVSCMDLPDAPLPKAAVSILKQLVGDDPISVEAKYKNPRTIYRKPIMLFASNHGISVPRVEGEQAFINRMVLIPFYNPCRPDQMIPHLYQELLRESPYIVRQAIEALDILLANNRQPTQVPVPEAYLLSEGSQNLRAVQHFFTANCICETDSKTSTDELYAAFLETGLLEMSFIDFSRSLRQIIDAHAPSYVCEDKHINGKRGYRGIRLRMPEEDGDISF